MKIGNYSTVPNMANPIQWARRRWHNVIPFNETPERSMLCPFMPCCRNRNMSRLVSKHRVVVPCSERFKDEYENITKGYKNNRIRTTKYTLLNFIPRNLFEQFHRAANLYFLFLVFLNWVPVVEAFQKEITMVPLVVVLIIIGIKDGLEDYRKHKLDKVINNILTQVYCRKEKQYVKCYWKDVKVGNFIKLQCDEIIPADMVLLHSSDPDGICHIETSSLDGENNLKQRQVAKGYIMDCELDPEMFSSKIQCEAPNSDLGRFKGFLANSDREKVGLSNQNLLLRGCIVRNTEAVVGIVVYAGHDTKTMLNNSGPRYKRSKLERQLNADILWCVLLLLIMCLFGALGYGIWLKGYPEPPAFILPEPNGERLSPALAGFFMFWTMIIILQVLIPISLYVSIEVVKLGQVYFIQNDKDFYCEKSESVVECRALNICEDLGQVQYIFSDKTGTLTENKMVFRRCSIAGVEYSHKDNAKRLETYQESELHYEEILDGVCSSKSATCRSKSHSPKSLRSTTSNKSLNKLPASGSELQGEGDRAGFAPLPRSVAFSSPMEKDVVPDPGLLKKFCSITPHCLYLSNGAEKTGLETTYIIDFFLALAICNTVVVSLPNQPRQKVRMPSTIKTPMKSLEEIKQMFQRFSVRKLSSTSLPSGKDSSAETPNNFMNKVPFFSRLKLASPAEGDRSLEVSLDSTSEMHVDGLPEYDFVSPTDATDKPTTCELYYEAESPDEAALVYAARAYKCTLQSRTPDQVTVELGFLGPLTFQLLHILPFDSVRKRMSVVVRHPIANEVVVYTKGADSVIMDLLALASDVSDNKIEEMQMEIRSLTQKHLDKYAKGGLRTLCIAKKVMTDEEYAEWLHGHRLAETSIDNREELLYESALKLETNLMLLGATGIEDRLQEGVPETIESLRKAGIKIWMLTGDKEETAVNIAYSCQLLEDSYKIFSITRQERATCEVLIDNIIDEIEKYLLSNNPVTKEEKSHNSSFEKENADFAMIIDGKSLEFALDETLEKKFIYLTEHCKAVICCRATPLQKSQVVKLVRNSIKVMTLAIGDGANDVSMIQVADIGVGISGQEGMQAVMSSDFAVSHFKHLRKLLLVHGHWCYTRLANMILYFFYKNVMFVNLLFWYQFFCGFSGTSMVDVWMLILFNLIFTSVPPIIYGVLDKDVSADTLIALPELYKSGQTSEAYKKSTFWINILDAFYQSLACFFIPYFTYFGSNMDIYSFGNVIITATLFVVLLHLLIESKSMTWIHWTVMVLSVAAYFVFTLAVDAICLKCMPPANPYWIMQTHMTDPVFYLVCVMSVVVALLPRFAFRVFQGTVFPTPLQSAKQLDVMSPVERSSAIKDWFLTKTDSTLFHTVPADGSKPTKVDEESPCMLAAKDSEFKKYNV